MHDDIDVAAIPNGAHALDVLAQQPFDCGVVDLRLPDMSGFALLDRLQSDSALRDMPIVVFTGKELSGRAEGLRLGLRARHCIARAKCPNAGRQDESASPAGERHRQEPEIDETLNVGVRLPAKCLRQRPVAVRARCVANRTRRTVASPSRLSGSASLPWRRPLAVPVCRSSGRARTTWLSCR